MDAGGQKRTLFHLSAVHKDTLTLVMDRKEEKDKDAIGRALAAGYRARTSLEEALFCLEEVKGIEGSIDGSISSCQEFIREYARAIDAGMFDNCTAGTLRCGMDEAADAAECLKGLVDGYRSLDGDKH